MHTSNQTTKISSLVVAEQKTNQLTELMLLCFLLLFGLPDKHNSTDTESNSFRRVFALLIELLSGVYALCGSTEGTVGFGSVHRYAFALIVPWIPGRFGYYGLPLRINGRCACFTFPQ